MTEFFKKIKMYDNKIQEYIDDKIISYNKKHPKALSVVSIINGMGLLGLATYYFIEGKKKGNNLEVLASYTTMGAGITSIALGSYYLKNKN